MSRAAVSVFVFSIYLFILGAILVVVPNTPLALFRMPETGEVWIRVVGMLVLILGYYDLTAARNELVPFVRATILGRLSVFFFVAFAALGFAPPVLVLLGALDSAAALWTWRALRASAGRQVVA